MPRTRVFPGARLSWAEHTLRTAPTTRRARRPREGGGWPRPRDDVRRPATAGGCPRRLAARRRGPAVARRWRPTCPTPSTAVVGVPRGRRRRRGLVVLLPRLRRRRTLARLAQLEPVVLLAADGYHWVNGRTVDRSDVVAQLARGAAHPAAHRPRRRRPPRPAGPRRGRPVGGGGPPRAAAGLRAGRVLAPAVGALHVRDDGAAQGSGPRPRRHRPRGEPSGPASTAGCAPGSGCSPTPPPAGRCGTSAARRADPRREHRALRGQSGVPARRGLGGGGPHRTDVMLLGAAVVTASQASRRLPARGARPVPAAAHLMVSGSALPPAGYHWFRGCGAREPRPAHRLHERGTDISGAFVGANEYSVVRPGRFGGRPPASTPRPGTSRAAPSSTRSATSSSPSRCPRCRCTSSTTRTAPLRGVLLRHLAGSLAARRLGDRPRRRDRLGARPLRLDPQPQGVRLGSSDFYDVLATIPQVAEALVVGVDQPRRRLLARPLRRAGRRRRGRRRARQEITTTLRTAPDPRHVPDEIVAAPGVPHTLSGKKLEVPVKKLLRGSAGAGRQRRVRRRPRGPALVPAVRRRAPRRGR